MPEVYHTRVISLRGNTTQFHPKKSAGCEGTNKPQAWFLTVACNRATVQPETRRPSRGSRANRAVDFLGLKLTREDSMKRNIVTNAVVAIVFALALVSLVPSAHGQQCSLALAAGKYGF